jgi:hypothetical protein
VFVVAGGTLGVVGALFVVALGGMFVEGMFVDMLVELEDGMLDSGLQPVSNAMALATEIVRAIVFILMFSFG